MKRGEAKYRTLTAMPEQQNLKSVETMEQQSQLTTGERKANGEQNEAMEKLAKEESRNGNRYRKQLMDRVTAIQAGKSKRNKNRTGQMYFCPYCSNKLSVLSSLYRHFGYCKKLAKQIEHNPGSVPEKICTIKQKQMKNIEKIEQTKKLRKLYAFGIAYTKSCLLCGKNFNSDGDMYVHFSTEHDILI